MNRKEWPAWKKWIWHWQFVLASVVIGLFVATLAMQIRSITRQYLTPIDSDIVTGQVVSVVTDDWVAFLGQGEPALLWPYKYLVEFEYEEQICRIETPYWDWRESVIQQNEFYFGHSVQVAVDLGCDAHVVSRTLAARWIGTRVLYGVTLISLIALLLFQHTKLKKYE
jgi:hypothetical protein